jgi:DNA-binding MarR family transcriptional regulator
MLRGHQPGNQREIWHATEPMRGPIKVPEQLSPSAVARLIITTRDLRDRTLPGMRFTDPAWDILLDLFIATRRGQALTVSDVGLASRVPHTTALRWVDYLIDKGALESEPDSNDKRRRLIRLTPDYLARMEGLLETISASILAAEDKS